MMNQVFILADISTLVTFELDAYIRLSFCSARPTVTFLKRETDILCEGEASCFQTPYFIIAFILHIYMATLRL